MGFGFIEIVIVVIIAVAVLAFGIVMELKFREIVLIVLITVVILALGIWAIILQEKCEQELVGYNQDSYNFDDISDQCEYLKSEKPHDGSGFIKYIVLKRLHILP